MSPAPRRVRLSDLRPAFDVSELVARFRAPHRFAAVRFDTYVPDAAHPSQAAALAALRELAATLGRDPGRRRRLRRGRGHGAAASGIGLYLDGGFGVGKTHLLASLWHEAPGPSAYLSFEELTATIGFAGIDRAVREFASHRLLCIDEFELDDVAETLMTVTFLRRVLPGGTSVVTTSNSLPDRLGEGRFHADDFKREIAAIAAHFDVVRIDGPDYRHRSFDPVAPVDGTAYDRLVAGFAGTVGEDSFDALLAHLRAVHPVQYGSLLHGLAGVAVRGLHAIANQGDALLFVRFVDELYDAAIPFVATGCGVQELFPAEYRNGGYRTKYGRAESRLGAMLAETASA